MKKLLVVGLVAVVLAGCGKLDRMEASLTGYTEMCVKGVKYIQFTSGASVMYNQDGSLIKC